jgi:hypothetical protein
MTIAPVDVDHLGSDASARPRVLTILALSGAALVLLFALIPHSVSGDGYVRFLKLDALLRDHIIRRDPYPLIGPFFAAPLWWVGDSRLWWFARFNVMVLAAGMAVAWSALRSVMTATERASAVLLLGATGMMPNATTDFYGEMFSAVMVGTGLLLVWIRQRWVGWIPLVLGVANMPASAVGLLFVAFHRGWRARRVDGIVALAAASALILIQNTVERSAPFDGGYAGNHGATTLLPYSGMPGFSYPLILGLVSLLFSFGKGLLFFAPGVLLVRRAGRDRPRLAAFFESSMAFLAGLVLVYAKWWAWYGGWKWGPRFLLFAAYPSAFALAVALARRGSWRASLTTIGVVGWTVWVGVSGAAFDLTGLDECIANGYVLEHLCWYVPEYSPLLRPFVLPPPSLLPWQQAWMLFAAVVFAVLITSGPFLDGILKTSTRRPASERNEADA